jgi:hypothetical protein
MRVIVATFTALMVLAAISVQAAPVIPIKEAAAERSAAPIEPVRDGCGYGYYRTRWQDGWGRWYWGRCVAKWWGKGAFLPSN